MRQKMGQNLFFTRKFCFYRINPLTRTVCLCHTFQNGKFSFLFQKVCVFNNFYVLRVNWDLSHSRMRQKMGQNLFFTVESFFSRMRQKIGQNFVFSTTFSCYRINPLTSRVLVKILCWPELNVLTEICHTRMLTEICQMRQKIGQNLFFTGKFSFLFQKVCVFNNFLV